MKKVAVVGATGYTGQELIRLILQHDKVSLHTAVSQSSGGKKLAEVYPSFAKFTDLTLSAEHIEDVAAKVDLIFMALPHGIAAKSVTKKILDKCAVIDLGADFRLQNTKEYEQWYEYKHPNKAIVKEAVYGLPELNREKIKDARLVANPGCYATCSILTLTPLLQAQVIDLESIIVDGKSGVSGAGRSLALGTHFDECNESIKAYKVGCHRHTPEIEQELSVQAGEAVLISFTPHLVPMHRGILITSYSILNRDMSEDEIFDIYKSAYRNEPFIRLFDTPGSDYRFPETRWVKGSNFCDIGLTIDARTDRVIAVGAIDNLIKGAAGQAIQNMNIMFGWDETTGLNQVPTFPS